MNQVVYESTKSKVCTESKQVDFKSKGYLLLRIGNEFYGIEERKVIDVIGKEPVISIPFMPEYIIGVINFEKNLIPVMDLRRKFNYKKDPISLTYSNIAIIIIDEFRVGIVVDDVTEYQEHEHENFYLTSGESKRNISGFVKMGGLSGILLDVEKIILQEKSELEILKNSILWSFK
jgi:purine-binding chemotaxis protein CheW